MPQGRAHAPARAALYDHPVYQAALVVLRRRLKELRAARRWTMEEAADRCGLLYQNYQAIEAGRVNVTLLTLARIADGFRAELAELLVPDESAEALRRPARKNEADRVHRHESPVKDLPRERRPAKSKLPRR